MHRILNIWINNLNSIIVVNISLGAQIGFLKKQITLDYFIMVIVICRKLISFIDLSQSSYKSQCKNRCILY